jgi:hypothetical protein
MMEAIRHKKSGYSALVCFHLMGKNAPDHTSYWIVSGLKGAVNLMASLRHSLGKPRRLRTFTTTIYTFHGNENRGLSR